MTFAVRKKLIEVSIPLEAINKASAREKATAPSRRACPASWPIASFM
jgi:adenine-specific DNA methylase